ncbi:MAG: porin family protein [Chelatococcus sp.]|nr:porin family protein [Chelatococcus sp. YT9]MBX3557961.1 porin family protein [Chelatococcus sp.]
MELIMKGATFLAAVAASAVIASAGLATGALAADLPSRTVAPVAPVAPIVPIFTWTGFYVGVNAGYGWNTNNNDNNVVYVPGTGYIGTGSSGSDGGFVGGGQIGYNYQFGQFVAGVEADIQYADMTSNNNNGAFYAGTGYIGSQSNGVDWFGTVRARLGFAFDRALIYGTGGFAYGGGNSNGYYYNGLYYKNGDDTRTGWTLGAGVEYAFTDNITARIEGLYVNLGKSGNNAYVYDANYFNGSKRKDTEFGVVRAGLNYKFSSF